jgi:hypothetical protein
MRWRRNRRPARSRAERHLISGAIEAPEYSATVPANMVDALAEIVMVRPAADALELAR